MKVIKHLKHETPEHKLKLFFKQMPLVTRIMLPLITTISILLMIINSSRQFNIYSFFDSRPISQMLILLAIGLTDFQQQERRGSIFLILSYFSKILIIAGFNKLISVILYLVGVKQGFFYDTSYPLLYCFVIAYRDMVLRTSQQRYFFIAPFQIKYLFYPLFLVVILQLISLRIDLITALIASVLITAIKFDELLSWISIKLDKKLIGNRALSFGLLATGNPNIAMAQIDRITTNHSIVLDEN